MRTKQPLGAAEYAILGILYLGSRHAYDLASDLAADTELALVCRVERGIIYSLVRRVEQAGLVVSERDEQANRPARNVLSLTAAGRDELYRWLDEPVLRIRDVRQDFFLKVFFSLRISGHDTRGLIDRQIGACRTQLERFRRQRARADSAFACLVLDSKVATAENLLSWLDSRREDLLMASPPARSHHAADAPLAVH